MRKRHVRCGRSAGGIAAAAFLIGLVVLPAAALAQATSSTEVETAMPPTTLLSCSGELVDVSGRIHNLVHVTESSSGNIVLELEQNFQGVSGVGQVTHLRYSTSAVDETSMHFNATTGLPIETTIVSSFQLVRQGELGFLPDDLTAHLTTRFIVDVTGVEVIHEQVRGGCR
jgi:hypothetical protein